MEKHKQKPPLLGIPENLTLAEIMKRQGHAPKSEAQIQNARAKMALAAQEQVRQTTNIPSPRDDSIKLDANTEIDDSFAVLPIANIDFYEHNPRKASNEAFAELKENIRVNNIMSPLTVTKRPNTNPYILYAGGNTRLLAIKQLFAETGDPRFETTRVIIKAWRGEATVMLAHMAENTQRSDMTFWDKANGTLEIKRQMEADSGEGLSSRKFEEALRKEGIQFSHWLITTFQYTTEKLAPIGPYLSGNAVKAIQPKLNALTRLASAHNIDENAFNSTILNPILLGTAERLKVIDKETELKVEFSLDQFLLECDTEVARRCEITIRDLNKMLAVLERDPKLNLLDLQEAVKTRVKSDTSPVSYRQSVLASALPVQTHSPEATESAVIAPQGTQAVWTGLEVTQATSHDVDVMQQATQDEFIQEQVTHERTTYDNLDKLKQIIQQVIIAAGLGNCYVEAPSMPLGYYMQFDRSGPLDLRENAIDAQSVWWLLALSSGQYDPDLVKTALPENCEWRQLTEDRHPQYSVIGSLDIAAQNNIGGAGAYLQAPWLLDWNNPASLLSLEFILALKAVETQGRVA